MFKPVSSKVSFPELETRVLEFWKDRDIAKRSVEERRDRPQYVMFEGPPTANAGPGIHHVLVSGLQGHHAPLQDDEGLLRAPQSGLGHPRPARRAGGREESRHYAEGADRGARHRRVQRRLQAERDALREGVGGAHRPHRLLDRHGAPLRHLRKLVYRVDVVDPEAALGPGPDLRGL